ncbi:hypothetical protein HXX76_003893 [Chlamydomonas incerta]|uniref:Uncharacterized protein n=1 Tax=Chlamydomonas incerta TaxID=51695 RepID=A0A835W6C0_CHLIN|nr:hypothetical protein HXX76_003893 [Chlamydomonas incerta]|eukprot:KAG2441040.1 hypothetical protein HXX76_003893 [Chlamydomonas incerta]
MTGRGQGGASAEERDAAAQELFGKRFEQCDSMERIKVGAGWVPGAGCPAGGLGVRVGGHIGGSRVIDHTSGDKSRTLDDGAGGGGDSNTSEAGRKMKQQKQQFAGQREGQQQEGQEQQGQEEQGQQGQEVGVEAGVEDAE